MGPFAVCELFYRIWRVYFHNLRCLPALVQTLPHLSVMRKGNSLTVGFILLICIEYLLYMLVRSNMDALGWVNQENIFKGVAGIFTYPMPRYFNIKMLLSLKFLDHKLDIFHLPCCLGLTRCFLDHCLW